MNKSIKDTSLQKKASTLQAMANTTGSQGKVLIDNRSLIQKKANNTGLPDNLKSGIENLSGHAMDDVKVHYNSDKPAKLNAHAYAQGSEIHLASGKEKHLPHEAWHVVQQKQGRVKPTMQMKGKVNVNDDAGLEKEADVMGAKALQTKSKSDFLIQKKNDGKKGFGFLDNRPKAIAQRKIQNMINNNYQVSQLRIIQKMSNNITLAKQHKFHSITDRNHKLLKSQKTENLEQKTFNPVQFAGGVSISIGQDIPNITQSTEIIQRAATIALNSSGKIEKVTMGKRPSYWPKSVTDVLGPMPAPGYHICHKNMSKAEQTLIIYKYTGMTLTDAQSHFGVVGKANVEAAIWQEYLNDYFDTDNLEWGPGGPNSSLGASAAGHIRKIIKDDSSGLTYPVRVGTNIYNDRDELNQATRDRIYDVGPGDAAMVAAKDDEYKKAGCVVM